MTKNIIDKFQTLGARRWPEALPVIAEIVARAPHIATIWINFGVCRSELKQHATAADKFLGGWQKARQAG